MFVCIHYNILNFFMQYGFDHMINKTKNRWTEHLVIEAKYSTNFHLLTKVEWPQFRELLANFHSKFDNQFDRFTNINHE